MKKLNRLVSLATAPALWLCACTTDSPIGSERERYTVDTPLFADNRVFIVCGQPTAGKTMMPVKHAYEAPPGSDCAKKDTEFVAGDSINVIVSDVRLPSAKAWGVTSGDIAVVIDIFSASDGSGSSYVVWYQRSVTPNQNLNFSNLLIYHQDQWDNRIAPLIRIRVIDVAKERNQETLSALNEIQKNIGALSQLGVSSSVISSPIVQLASSAAKMVLAGRTNQSLLDYTVQFYPERISVAYPGTTLIPFRKGAYVLIGRDRKANGNLWLDNFCFDEKTAQIYTQQGYDCTHPQEMVDSPYARLYTIPGNFRVQEIVAERAQYLTHLLSSGSTTDLDHIPEEAKRTGDAMKVYAAVEKLQRSRQLADLKGLVGLLKPEARLDPAYTRIVTDTLTTIAARSGATNCPLDSYRKAKAFLEGNSDAQFDTAVQELKLKVPSGSGDARCPGDDF
jgi:hypothetical protein